MKNKEIEELLNELKEVTNSKKLSSTYCITNKHWQLLLSYIEQLEAELQEVNDSVTWWQNRYNAVKRDKKQLENNRDKAIEYNKNILKENWYGGYEKENAQKNIDILKGGSDE